MPGLLGGVLPTIYSRADAIKRGVSALFADPVGTFQQAAGQLQDSHRNQQALDALAFSDPSQPFKVTNRQARDQMAMNVLGGVLGFAPAGIMAGVGAKTADKAALSMAQQMERKGVAPEVIWRETGWGKGPDGLWRFEIDDSAAKLRDYFYTPKEAYANARQRAVSETGSAESTKRMAPYSGMTKTQLVDEYRRTGGEIIDAARAGKKDEAKSLMQARGGLDDMLGAMRDRNYGPASAYMKHGDLGAAYPDVYKLHTRIDDSIPAGSGHHFPGSEAQGEQVVLGKRPAFTEDKSLMLHELQHAIQQREGFARGGSPDSMRMILEDLADRKKTEARTLMDSAMSSDPLAPVTVIKPGARARSLAAEKEAQRANDWLVRLEESPNYRNDAYRSLAGEAEARLVQSRMKMTPEQRRALFPWDPASFKDATGVPLDSLILR